jgi:tetratricopeptide (TPR) repeat protein
MKLINKRRLLTSFSILIFSALPALAEKRIAVLPFEILSEKNDLKQFGVGTTDTLTTALSTVKEFIMLDRGQIQAVMKENAFQQSAFVDPKTSVKLGSLLGAEVLVMGSIQTFEDSYRINSHFTEVKTGKILKSAQVTGKNIFELQDQLSQELIKFENVVITESEQKEITSVTKATSNINAYELFTKGRNEYLLFTREGLEKSITYYDEALKLDSNYDLALASKAEAQALLCYDLFKNDEPYQDIYNQAEKNATKALELNPNSSIALRAMSVFLISRGDYKEAEKYLTKALEINPNDAEAYVWMYEILEDSKEKKDISYLDKALNINPYLVPANKKYSDFYLDKGKYDLAKDYLIKILKVNPLNSFSYYKISKIDEKEKNINQAIKSIKQAIKITPQYPFLHSSLARLYISNKKYDDAVKSANKSVSLNNKYIYGYKYLAMANYYKKDFNNAIKAYQEVYNLDPKDTSNIYLLASSYFKVKNYAEAEVWTKKLLELDNKYSNAHGFLASIYQLQNKKEEANNEYLKEIELNGNNVISLYSVGNYYYEQKKYNEATIYFKKLLELEPNFDNSVYLYLGDCYKALGLKNKSEFYHNNYLAKVEKELKKNPNDYVSLLGIAYLYKEMGNYKESIKYYEKVSKIAPSNEINLELADLYSKTKANKKVESTDKLSKSENIVIKPEENIVSKNSTTINKEKNNSNVVKEEKVVINKKVNNDIKILDSKSKQEPKKTNSVKTVINTKNTTKEKSKIIILNKDDIISEFYSTTDTDKRISLLIKLIQIEPDSPDFHNNLGALYHQKGDLDKALIEYNEAINIKPDFAASYENIGMIYEAKRNKVEASKFYKKACDLGRSSACEYLRVIEKI